MRRLRDRLRARARADGGYTLVELMVSVALLMLAAGIFLTFLWSVQRGVNTQSSRSLTNDQARLAIEQLDHEIRSGNLLYDPSAENDPANGIYPGMSLRIYTQTNADIRNPGNQCVQWRIVGQVLENRYWATNWRDDPSTLVSDWRIIAQGLMNQTVSPQVQAFTLDPDPNKGGRTIDITLIVNESANSQNVTVSEAVTGRNTEYGYPNDVCADIPPY
jgi:type II secretory pathway component PulJ